jgi:NADP-dependent 3-hydroxy acid dehydrogenase YdfG
MAGRRVVVVGASSGIGEATARRAADAGAKVVVAARRTERLKALCDPGRDAVTAVHCDVTDPNDCTAVVSAAVMAMGGIDDIVYAAGVSDLALVKDTPQSEWLRILKTNVIGLALVFAAAHEHLVSSRGHMLVISSISVLRPKPGLVPYGASKAAVHKLVEGLRTENPKIAFTIVTIGPTGQGEFGSNFDPLLSAELRQQWKDGGFLAPGQMAADEVADRIVDCLAAPMRIEELVLLPDPEG